MSRRARRGRVRNRVKLEPFQRLVEVVEAAQEWTPTSALLMAAGLSGDLEGGRGGLKMLHVLGDVHARRGSRRGLLWRQGALPEELAEVADLGAYRRLHGFLMRFEGNYIATDAIMEESGLTKDRPGALGALKVLEAAFLVSHRHPGTRVVHWCYGDPGNRREVFRASGFDGLGQCVSIDAHPGLLEALAFQEYQFASDS